MTRPSREMRLTSDHVRRITQPMDDLGPMPGWTPATEEDHDVTVAEMLNAVDDPRQFWFFAYGSLIWKPACDVVEMRTGVLRGWHRSFCLGWNTRHRGSDTNPGLMLALDRGGTCTGVLYRLPSDAVAENLKLLLKREMGAKPSPFPPRFVNVRAGDQMIRALTFVVDRKAGRYVSGLSEREIAQVLALAVGHRGSMTEYLFNTVQHLEQMGIHDRHLWRLQEMVAERLDQHFAELDGAGAETVPAKDSDAA